jgi:acetyl esterase/lipase
MTTSIQSSSNNKEQPILPGRLADPNNILKTDPRADPRMVAALAPFGLDIAPAPAPVTADSSLQEQLDYIKEAEVGFEGLFAALYTDLPPIEDVERRTEVIKGVDNNDISLYIHKPKNASGPLPCVYHIHGGGMVILEAAGPCYKRWRDELSAAGMVVVGVEFRNGAGKLGNHPFPAGLNDCMSGLQWTFDNKATLGISKIIVSGESGGGNLTLAVTLKAKKDGKIDQIDGTYALCPYISKAWAHKIKQLPSLYENDDLFLNCSMMGVLAVVYDPEHKNDNNPLCWPFFAKREDLQGLPPHVISVNQLDPLRDEGLKYYQMLLAAGVSVYSRTVNGTCHAGDVIFRKALPEVSAATIRDIKGFAYSL